MNVASTTLRCYSIDMKQDPPALRTEPNPKTLYILAGVAVILLIVLAVCAYRQRHSESSIRVFKDPAATSTAAASATPSPTASPTATSTATSGSVSGPAIDQSLKAIDAALSAADSSSSGADNAPADSDTTP